MTLLLFAGSSILAQSTKIQKDTPLFEKQAPDSLRPPTYTIRSLSTGLTSLRDQFLSPLLYQGMNLGTLTNHFIYKPDRLIQRSNHKSVAFMTNEVTESTFASLDFGFRYGQFFPIQKLQGPDTRVYAGGFADLSLNANVLPSNQNNPFSYALPLSLGASALVEHKFFWLKRHLMFSGQLSLPLLSVLSRTPYAWVVPNINEGGYRFGEVVQLGTLNRYFHLENRISLDFYLPSAPRIYKELDPYRLSYHWTFRQFSQPNQLQIAHHMITLGKIIR